MNELELFKNYYLKEKSNLDGKLNELNKKLLEEENELVLDNVRLLTDLNSDGKLIRGILVKLGYSLLNEDESYADDMALAYEMFQTAILIHDDIIDNDCKRRGKDTVHYANEKYYSSFSDDKDEIKHLSNSIAICMGDYGLYVANKIVCDKYYDNPNLGKVLADFNNTVLTTIKGELIDVILPFQGKHNLLSNEEIDNNILEIYRLKTSYYTIIGPMSVGIILAGGEKDKLKDIEEFGEKVGIAFQIQDDILGIYSNEMGKVKGSDIKEFKQTILYSHILNTEYKDELLEYYGKEDINEENVNRVQELFKISGSYDYAFDLMNKMYDEALDILSNIKWIDEDKNKLLRGFVEYLRKRNK